MARWTLSGLPHLGQGSPACTSAQVRPVRHLDVAADGDVAEVEAVLVGAGGHVGRVAQAFVGIDRQRSVTPHRAEAARMRAERGENLLRPRPGGSCAVPSAPASLASFNWSSPRTRISTGLLSAI